MRELAHELAREDCLPDADPQRRAEAVAERHERAGDGEVVGGQHERHGAEGHLATDAGAEGGEDLVADPLAGGAGRAEGEEEAGADGGERAAGPHERDVVAAERDQAAA